MYSIFIISAMLVSRWDAYSVTMGEYYYRYYAQMFEGNITEKTLERIEQEQKYIEIFAYSYWFGNYNNRCFSDIL